MKSESEKSSIKQKIESLKSQIKSCETNMTGHEFMKKNSSDKKNSDFMWDSQIANDRRQIDQLQREIDNLYNQLTT